MLRRIALYGWVPEWPKGADCKSVSNAFGGSNPPPSTLCRRGGTGRRTGLKILRDLYSRTGSIPVAGILGKNRRNAQIAQSVEQRTENPRVTGSIPVLGTARV